MARSVKSFVLLAWCGIALLAASAARAECGTQDDCIAVSIDPTVAPAHGTPLTSVPLEFGNQTVGTTSATLTIYVGAVTGTNPATLQEIALGPIPSDFRISGGTCTVGTASLPHNGATCTITVTFNPASVGAKTASITVRTNSITRTVPLTGTGTVPLPTASPATLTVQASTPTTLDLAGIIGGAGTLAVRVVAPPAHGGTSVNGTRVTYTPATNYLGPDAMSYEVFNDAAASAPAVITINVVARPDPAADATVVGLLRAQNQTARRFARAQITNIQSRMESLHRRTTAAVASRPFAEAAQASGTGLRVVPRADSVMVAGIRPEGIGDGTLLPAGLASALIGAARSGSFNVSARGGAAEPGSAVTGIWMGGNVQFGSRDQTGDTNGLRFSTDGLSAGVDRHFGDRLALGLSVGYARDRTDIGADGSQSRARGSSIALYASHQPSEGTFIDGLLGYGALDFDSDRFVAAANDFARGTRKGNQWFGSVAAGYEFRDQSLLLSPYGRLDFARARLQAYTESGAGLGALTYFEQRVPTLQFSLGLRVESAHETAFGWALPRLRVEWRHAFKGEREATLAYADLPAGPLYTAPLSGEKRNSLLLGLGSDFVLRGGMKLGLDYQVQRLSGVERSQAVRLWLSQELDGRGFVPARVSTRMFDEPLRVEGGMTWDDNVNRARDAGDKLIDRVFGLNLGKGIAVPLGDHTRVVFAGFAAADKFARYARLDRVSAGGQAEFQYRPSAEFTAPTFGVFGRLGFDEYAGQLRSGHRYSLGVSARQSLTDRIDVFGALAGNVRNAAHSAFDGRDTSLRFNLDFALHRSGTLYLGGEYRRGDVVSSLPQSLGYAGIAKASVPDDAFGLAALTAYRFEAKTTLWTLGYNWALGPRDALDLSMRRAESKTTVAPTGIYAGSNTYTANQYSVAYLMRF